MYESIDPRFLISFCSLLRRNEQQLSITLPSRTRYTPRAGSTILLPLPGANASSCQSTTTASTVVSQKTSEPPWL